MSPTPGTFPYGSRPLSCKGGGLGVWGGGGLAFPLPLPLGLGLALFFVCWASGRRVFSATAEAVFSWGPWGAAVGFGGPGGGVLSPLVLLLMLLLLVVVSPARACTLN